VVLVLGAAAVLLSMRMWPYRVLDMTNIIGGAIAVVCLMRYYLPLEAVKERPPGSSSAREPATGAEA
jgi:hypothetical protein